MPQTTRQRLGIGGLRRSLALLAVVATAALGQVCVGRAAATPPSAPSSQTGQADRQRLTRELGPNWWTSRDRLIESTVDASGYHIFLALGATGYAWQSLATLRPAGYDTGTWTGYSCLTGSGDHIVAVVAPGYFANSPLHRDRGAFAYVVDVPSGAVQPLVGGVALKYYSPGCGAGNSAVLTRNPGVEQQSTQLLMVDAAKAALTGTVTVPGQLTSAVPDGTGQVLAAAGPNLVRLDRSGRRTTLATAKGQVYDVVPQGGSDASFLASSGKDAIVYRLRQGRATQAGRGDLSGTQLYAGRSGRATLVARSLRVDSAPAADMVISTGLPDVVDGVSLDGQVVAGRARGSNPQAPLDLRSVRTGRTLVDSSDTGPARPANASLPAMVFPFSGNSAIPRAVPRTAGTPTCAVPRNSVTGQVPQPGRQQVERAVDLAVSGNLFDARPANYLNMGLGGYSASGDFGPNPLLGAASGVSVPAQVYLGILAQESNFDQASWHALPGIPANPLIADYYGAGGGVDQIDYPDADCGYGIGQVTTGMRAADTSPYSDHDKLKIAVDYEENIAAGLQILEDKWNQLYQDDIIANNGDPRYVENWYFAIWAYNTGIQPDARHGNTTGCTPGWTCTDTDGNWGLGWANNPVNPDYPPGRPPFLRRTYGDAAHPSSWPYQERVLGWIDTPQKDYKGDAEYVTPSYGSQSPQDPGSVLSLPDHKQFCVSVVNNCYPNDPTKQYCGYSDPSSANYDHCWWHASTTWAQDCTSQCAVQALTYQPGSADPGVTDPHPADCRSKLPSDTTFVDDLSNPAINIAGCSGMNWSTNGSFSLTYGTNAAGDPLAVIDTHQLGVGFGGHLEFTHNVNASDTAHRVTGTWTVKLATHLYNVYVHVPSTGGTTNSAHYKVTGADGTVYDRVVNQDISEDEWSSLGYLNLSSNAKVTLNNVTDDQSDNHDVAFDAVAFVPVSGTFQHHTYDAVSIFAPDQNLDTSTPSQFNTPLRNRQTLYAWATERTVGGHPWDNPGNPVVKGLLQYPECGPGAPTTSCVGTATRQAMSAWSTQVQAAGTSTAGPVTEATWMGLSVPRPDPSAPPNFGSDLTYKIKTHVDVSYAADSGGNIVPGSQSSVVTSRTGDTHLPEFLLNFMQATQTDYGIYGVSLPDLSYQETDANTHTGDPTAVANPLQSGYAPGRAYMPHYGAATIDSTGQCVGTAAITGGTIGYRPLDNQTVTDTKVNAWYQQLVAANAAGRLPKEVADTAGDMYSMFFRGVGAWPSPNGSLFNVAPPIWHNIKMAFCANGTIKSTQLVPNADDGNATAPVYQSYMPDLYLYLDGRMVSDAGHTSSSPVQGGNFVNFSNIPGLNPANNAYDYCDVSQRGNGGNPWNVSVPPLTTGDPRPRFVRYCDDPTSWFDETYAP